MCDDSERSLAHIICQMFMKGLCMENAFIYLASIKAIVKVVIET